MKKSFVLGAVAGMSTLALAVPMLAQIVGAQTTGSSTAPPDFPTPTQTCVQAMAGLADARLANFDTMMAQQKEMIQKRADELKAVAAITDDAARKEALKQMHEAMRGVRKDPADRPEAITTAMQAVKDACGGMMGGHGGFGFGGPRGGHMRGMGARGHMGKNNPNNDDAQENSSAGSQ